MAYTETVNYDLINRFYWKKKADVFAFLLGTIDASSKNDPVYCDKSDDREAVNLSGKVTETTEQDKESGNGGDEAALTYTVGVKEENARFQGKWAHGWSRCICWWSEGMGWL